MDVQASPCNNTSDPLCYEEGSDTLAVIIIPTLLALSTVVVVTTILCSLFCRRKAAPERTSIPAHYTNRAGQECVSTSPVGPWEIPGECTLEGLEFWQTGHYGPICRGTMRRKDIPSAVVVKTLRGGINQPEAKEFVDWILFHGTVCKHQNLVRMLYCQTQRLPMYLVLEACSPGNLLHYLWTLRNASDSESLDPLQNFSERSAFLVAMQVAAGLDYLLSEHRLVHGNVAAKNVLIGPGFSVRVSGLGLAFEVRHRQTEKLANRRCQNDKLDNQRTAEVPLKWQAPERIMNHPTTDRSDVWSFGIFLYELITLGSPPYPDLEPECVFLYLQKSNRMKRPDNCGGPLYDLMKYCWMWSFKDRPVFSAIIKLLGSYTYLAGTKYIYIPEGMDIIDYSKRAGVLP